MNLDEVVGEILQGDGSRKVAHYRFYAAPLWGS